MKKLFLVILMIMFAVSFATAERYEDNNFRDGTIDVKGDLIKTSDPINDVDVIGFVCSSENCGSVSGKLWDGNILNSINDFIQLVYPTDLLSEFGYAIYMFKDKYIPYEVNADWWGTSSSDPLGAFDNYLSRKEVCIVNINELHASQLDGNINVNVNVQSPIEHSGPLEHVPDEIKDHYKVDVDVNLEVVKEGLLYYSETQTIDILYSGDESVEFSFPADAGEYNISVYTSTNDEKCIDYEEDDEEIIIKIECDEDSDCGEDICLEENNYCLDGNVYHNYTTYTCNNPGTIDSYCSSESFSQIIAYCVFDCEDAMCISS